MSQGINRSYIFEETKDKEFYRKIFKEKEGDYDLEIITSCIMDNHVHFVIYTKKHFWGKWIPGQGYADYDWAVRDAERLRKLNRNLPKYF